jgi:hypothetical protein
MTHDACRMTRGAAIHGYLRAVAPPTPHPTHSPAPYSPLTLHHPAPALFTRIQFVTTASVPQ